MFIINKNKMAKVEKFRHLLVANKLSSFTKQFHAVNFNIDVPHANGTLFCVQETLCVVGGCDKDYEPFSDIHQFDQRTQEWKLSGFSSVSRFGASVVVFKGKNEKEPIFLAGGFKGKDTLCSIIEKLTLSQSDEKNSHLANCCSNSSYLTGLLMLWLRILCLISRT